MTFSISAGIAALLIGGGAMAAPLVTAYDNDGMITVNGKRTLIIGSYSEAKSDRPYKELAEAGFNLVHAGKDKLDKAHEAGLMTWTNAGVLDLDNREKSAKVLADTVNAVKDHPSLAFLETSDEPAWTWMKAEARVPWQAFAEGYPIIKKNDPNHLIYTNHAPTNLVKTLKQYNAGTDIVACDIYPVNPGGLHMFALFPDGFQGDFNDEHISQVGQYADKMREVAGPNRPVFLVLQAFSWGALEDDKDVSERREEKLRCPTYAEDRFMAFQSLIHGANGLLYWGSHTMPQPSQAWTDLKRAVREVADLKEPLAARRSAVPVAIDYHEMGHSVDKGVQWLAKEFGGKLYLFTCNADKNRCKATLSGLGNWTKCEGVGENRTIPVEKGSLTDVWRRFDVHIYKLM